VVLDAQIGLSQASDEEILKIAQEQNRILITRDRDYGNLVFVNDVGSYASTQPTKLIPVNC
ncbi:MAG: DUF5615 family PIN-like protein, partial [Nostoc sp.]